MDHGKYKFKPRYNIKSRSELLELLKHQFEEGLGNVLLNDVVESYRRAEVAVKKLESQQRLIRIVRKRDQNTILVYRHSDELFSDMGGNEMMLAPLQLCDVCRLSCRLFRLH